MCACAHSVAQVIGYYSAFDVSHPRPLVVIMTAWYVKVIIFPFRDIQQNLVNAVELGEFNFWNDDVPDFNVLKLLLSLFDECSVVRAYQREADYADIPPQGRIPKSNIYYIVTDRGKIEEMRQLHQKQNRQLLQQRGEMVQQRTQMQQQHRELQASRKREEEARRREEELREESRRREEELRESRRREEELREESRRREEELRKEFHELLQKQQKNERRRVSICTYYICNLCEVIFVYITVTPKRPRCCVRGKTDEKALVT